MITKRGSKKRFPTSEGGEEGDKREVGKGGL
jgi:hypothetical protein